MAKRKMAGESAQPGFIARRTRDGEEWSVPLKGKRDALFRLPSGVFQGAPRLTTPVQAGQEAKRRGVAVGP